jgi:hypothetical protein
VFPLPLDGSKIYQKCLPMVAPNSCPYEYKLFSESLLTKKNVAEVTVVK